jgi:hypothetical protein
LRRIHETLERGVGNIKKREVFSEKKKCTFRKEEVGYLRFIVEKRQVKTNLKKVETVSKWLVLQNQKKVREFLGLVNYSYYQKFIHRYAYMTTLLNELLRKKRHRNGVKRSRGI